MKKFSIVVAMDEERGIGKGGGLPWRLSRDMRRFKEVTLPVAVDGTSNAVIMGRKTWESLPEKYRPLPGRLNVVLSSDRAYSVPENVVLADTLTGVLSLLEGRKDVADVFVIGGGILFKEAIAHPLCQGLFITQVMTNASCDVFFPVIPETFSLVKKTDPVEENGYIFYFSDHQKGLFQEK